MFDATQTMVTQIADDNISNFIISWYDNENSYTDGWGAISTAELSNIKDKETKKEVRS